MSRQPIVLVAGGEVYEEWTDAEVVRDLKDFSGSFRFTLREGGRMAEALPYASPLFLKKDWKGLPASVMVDGVTVLVGWVESFERRIDAEGAEISVCGRDKSGDLVDCACAPDGPAEFRDLKLDEAARRICAPFGLKVRCEIEPGEPFPRYSLDLTESGLSAIEKGARQRRALVTSDGVGGIVITRTGAARAPADLRLPGNIVSSSLSSSDEDRYDRTVVRGQAEQAGGRRRGRKAALDVSAEPLAPAGRSPGDGSASEREAGGTALKGEARDPEIRRHRPIVHLARSQPDARSAQDEAEWRSRTRRGQSDELTVTVHGFSAGGRLWRVNELAFVDDAFQGIARDLLVSRVTMSCGEARITELALVSPEAFDAETEGTRRENRPREGKNKASKHKGGLDGTAEAL